MQADVRYVVCTSGDVEAGSLIAYLKQAMPLNICHVFRDTGSVVNKSRAERLSPQDRMRQLGWHVGLACRLRAYYGWKLVQKVTRRNQLEIIRAVERKWPALIRWLYYEMFDQETLQHPLLYSLTEAATRHGIDITEVDNINANCSVEALESLQPDVIIGIGTRILTPRVLATARIGVLNGHSSVLPNYRGSTSEFWQLAAGERTTGVTIHWMAPQVDRGEICGQRSWPIPRRTDHHKLRLISFFQRFSLWEDVIRRLENGTLRSIPQGEPWTPTFRRPDLKAQFDFYCKGVRPLEIDVALARK